MPPPAKGLSDAPPCDPRSRREGALGASTVYMVGNSPAMKEALDQIRRFAASDVPVLATGESGTGKELVARAIHDHSHRAAGPFVALNCAAVPPTLIASELFGYEKGAFTGASGRKHGTSSTRIAALCFSTRSATCRSTCKGLLLGFLQEGEILRVGGRQPIKVDVRIVAATNVRLKEAIAAGGPLLPPQCTDHSAAAIARARGRCRGSGHLFSTRDRTRAGA